MALPNKPLGELPATLDPAIVELDTDILIVGGGMAACGTAYEIKKWAPEGSIDPKNAAHKGKNLDSEQLSDEEVDNFTLAKPIAIFGK